MRKSGILEWLRRRSDRELPAEVYFRYHELTTDWQGERAGTAVAEMRITGLESGVPRRQSLTPTAFERGLAYGSIVLLVVVAVALVRGYSDWGRVSTLLWLHIGTIGLCLALTPALLLGKRGLRRHRQLGYAWVAAMSATALLTFGIHDINHGGLSPIHLLSAVTLTQAPMLAWHARQHRVDAHRYTVLSLVTGALLIAGMFTFPFGRMLGRWLIS